MKKIFSKLPDDLIQEVKDMLKEGLTVSNISNYLGLNWTSVWEIKFPQKKKARAEQSKKIMRKHQKYRR